MPVALIKGTAGFFRVHTLIALIAIESTTDIFASFLVLFGIKYSRPADKTIYGHGRAEPLITFIVVGFLTSILLLLMKHFKY
jgi:divalent metal cation (Fe/Co/Zn/Cd) transporter